MAIKTRFLIISDTHGRTFDVKEAHRADVVIHCGDLTEDFKIDEFRTTIDLLRRLPAPLKLVIAGNHDRTLDEPIFQQFVTSAPRPIAPAVLAKTYGSPGESRRLLEEARDAGIVFLDEGNYQFTLGNGATLKVYASPFTPALWAGRAFQYKADDGHDFAMANDTQVAITHGPPRGVMDYARWQQTNAGCPQLFAAVARAKPLLHCFGHIHSGWGAQLATWRGDGPEIDQGRSVVVENLSMLVRGQSDSNETARAKEERVRVHKRRGFRYTSHCAGDENPLIPGSQTLFVNAAFQWSSVGRAGGVMEQPPWLVDIELPSAAEQNPGA